MIAEQAPQFYSSQVSLIDFLSTFHALFQAAGHGNWGHEIDSVVALLTTKGGVTEESDWSVSGQKALTLHFLGPRPALDEFENHR